MEGKREKGGSTLYSYLKESSTIFYTERNVFYTVTMGDQVLSIH